MLLFAGIGARPILDEGVALWATLGIELMRWSGSFSYEFPSGMQVELHCKILLIKISGEQSCGSGLLRPPALQFLCTFPLTAP